MLGFDCGCRHDAVSSFEADSRTVIVCTASGGDSCSNNAHNSDLSCCCCAGAEGRQLAASIAQRWLLTMFESWSSTGTKFFHKSAFNCANGLMCTALLMSWM